MESIRFFLSWLTWPATQSPPEATSGPSVDGIAVYASEIKDGELFAYVPSEIATGKGGFTWRIIPFSKWSVTMVIISPPLGLV